MNEIAPALDLPRAMLLAMDYQRGILDLAPDSEALADRTAQAIRIAREGGVRVGYVRVAFEDEDYAAIPETNKGFSAVAANRRLPNDAPESAIPEALAPEPGDLQVRKVRVGAFSTTDLDRQLRSLRIDTLLLAGIATSGVVLTTVREASDRDYRLYVIEDCCADPDLETHDFLMGKIFPRQAHVITLSELSNLLRKP
jgi:nicotinamidase-related amidase